MALVRTTGIFQPEGRKQAFRMENLSWPLFAPPGFFNRKAESRPLGWKISLSTCGGRAAAMRERRPPPLREVWRHDELTFSYCALLRLESRARRALKLATPCFQGARAPQSHPLDDRETAIPPAEQARSAKRRRREMQFPSRTRTAKPQAEVCGPAR